MPHFESSFSMQICCPLSGLCFQLVPPMKWHCLSTLFLVFLFFLLPGTVPSIIPFSRDLSSPLMMWLKNLNFPLFTFRSKILLTPACSKTHKFVFFAVHDTHKICLKCFHLKCFQSIFIWSLHHPALTTTTGLTSVCKSRTLVSVVTSWLYQIFLKDDTMPCPLFNLAWISVVYSASLVTTAQKCK